MSHELHNIEDFDRMAGEVLLQLGRTVCGNKDPGMLADPVVLTAREDRPPADSTYASLSVKAAGKKKHSGYIVSLTTEELRTLEPETAAQVLSFMPDQGLVVSGVPAVQQYLRLEYATASARGDTGRGLGRACNSALFVYPTILDLKERDNVTVVGMQHFSNTGRHRRGADAGTACLPANAITKYRNASRGPLRFPDAELETEQFAKTLELLGQSAVLDAWLNAV